MTGESADNLQRTPHSANRVSRACQRCRRQKLKCDEARPCTMCVRSGVSCLSRDVVSSRSRAGKRTARRRGVTTPPPPTSQESHVDNRSYERRRFGASSSAVGFAVNIFGEYAASHSGDISSIPGHATPPGHPRSDWTLEKMSMPPAVVMDCLLEAYFQHVHWFIFLFHEQEFMRSVTPLLHQSAWKDQCRGRVVVALMMAALGLQCAMHDTDWPGHSLLASSSLQIVRLRDDLIAEVRLHLLHLMEECSLESVQVSTLLGTYYIYYGSPGLAWNLLGLSVRSAYGLSLHCESAATLPDQVQTQIRRRTWNHVTVADTFAAMIYGRPASLDAAFSGLHELIELEDTRLPSSVPHALQDSSLTGLTFQILKYRLYEIIRTGLNLFRLMNLQNPVTPDVFCHLAETILQIRTTLQTWRAELPSIFQKRAGFDETSMSFMAEPAPDTPEYHTYRTLMLQAQTLRLTYDSAVIFINRPLLEYQVSPEYRGAIADYMPVVRASMDLCLDAAVSISRISAEYHQNEFSVSFVLMNYFSAGVILCLIPTLWPFSTAASEAKSGLLRIIRTSRKLRNQSQIAQHTEQLLTRLLKRSHEQELENGLDDANPSVISNTTQQVPLSHVSSSYTPQPQSSTTNLIESHSPFSTRGHSNEITPLSSLEHPAIGLPFSNPDESERDVFSSTIRDEEVHETMPFLGENDRSYMMNHHVDEALGSFGQMLFNLVPNDPYSAWNWGNGLR